MPLFSIIMPSYLGQYGRCATNRREKLIRAIESVRSQSYKHWELIICADGCRETFDLVTDRYADDQRIECLLIDKRTFLDPEIRNLPIRHAKGQWITYLDSDDYMGLEHLQMIADRILANPEGDWLFYNDWIPSKGTWVERQCAPAYGKCGTANITHQRGLRVKWTSSTYGRDDWNFIQDLKQISKPVIIPATQYYVCHMPGKFDV